MTVFHICLAVVTDPKKAVVALKWAVAEMEERYRKMSKMGVRNIESFNLRVKEAIKNNENFTRTVQIGFDEETGEPKFEEQSIKPEYLPFIVIIVDEMADPDDGFRKRYRSMYSKISTNGKGCRYTFDNGNSKTIC